MKKNWQRLCSLIMPVLLLYNIIGNCARAEETGLTPYKKHTIPGIVAAADFDIGGEGISHSALQGFLQSEYKYRDDVQLNYYTNSAGVVMGLNTGEWMKYTVDVSESAWYNATALYATPENITLELSIGNNTLTQSLEATGDWQTISESSMGNLYLAKGKQVMTLKLISGGCTFRGIKFEKTDMNKSQVDFSRKTGPYRNMYIPAVIQAEDFDMTGNADSENKKSVYRAYEGIEITKNENNGYKIALSKGQKTSYTFTAEKSGAYDVFVCGQGSGNLYFDESEASLPVKCDTNETKLTTIWIDNGIHQISFSTQSAMTLDYIKFISSDGEYVTMDSLLQAGEDVDEETGVYKDFYVSPYGNDSNDGGKEAPFLTIERARDVIRSISNEMDGDIIVHIMSGTYYIDEQIEFTEADSGKNGYNIVYMGENVIDMPVINGGTEISGWEKVNDYLWKASAPIEDTRTLYINGFPAQRARSKYIYYAADYCKKESSQYPEDGIVTPAKNFLKDFSKPENMELVWDLYWTSQRTPVESIEYDESEVRIFLDQPWFRYARTKGWDGTNPGTQKSFYLENALELLDEPGEFYFDKDKKEIYYYPFEAEDMNLAKTYAGTTEFMLKASGSGVDKKISNIVFDNIEFRYGAWNGVNESGIVAVQADKMQKGEYDQVSYGGTMIPSQFTVEYAQNIVIQNCSFKALGSGAISMANAVSDSKIIGNKFCDISGSAIIIGHWDHLNVMSEGMERCVNIEVANNVIRRAAEEFRGGCGISLYYVNSVNVHNNDIKDVPYTGITLGWGWGEDISECANNTIAYNRIENVTSPTHDGAHIYTLGPLRNTVIKGNYCIKAGDYRGGIYLDEGTGYVSVTENVVEQSELWLFARPGARLKEIYAADNFSDTAELSQDEANVKVVNTTVVTDGKWPEKAVQIMENSGVENQYKRLLNGNDLPEWRTDFIHGTPQKLFGKLYADQIEAEDYIKGGEGIGYHKLSGDVQVYLNGFDKLNNYVIGDTKPGEWLKYEFDCKKTGQYSLQVKAANSFAESEPIPKVNVYIDEELAAQSVEIPNNGSWEEHIWTELAIVDVTEGKHSVKIEFDNNGFSFDAWKLKDENEKISFENDAEYDEGVVVKESELNKKLFNDIDGHWAEDYITEMAQKGVIEGVGNNMYEPDSHVTLYQAIWLAMRSAGMETGDAWKDEALRYGLLNFGEEKDLPVTRERVAQIIINAYCAVNGKYSLTWDAKAFCDFDDIGEDYKNFVLAAKTLGVMEGDSDTKFLPKNNLTRAEAAAVIKRLNDII